MTSSKKRIGQSPSRDHYQEMTDRVVAALEAGTRPWQRPWDRDKAAGPAGPLNGATGRRYHGVNVVMLAISSLAFMSQDPRWQTYKQAEEKGWQVKRGERATTVFFFKQLRIDDPGAPRDSDEQSRRIPILRSYPVFHASQIDGIPAYAPEPVETTPWRRPDAAEFILLNSKVTLRTGGERAFYSPSTDHIQLPPDSAFESPEGWSATALHELSHASGHPSRLARDLTGRFGSSAYAREELRAELASLMIGAELDLPTDIPNHASYLASWIEVLKQEKRELFRAAADAQKIADYILGFHPDYAAATEDEAPEPERQRAAA